MEILNSSYFFPLNVGLICVLIHTKKFSSFFSLYQILINICIIAAAHILLGKDAKPWPKVGESITLWLLLCLPFAPAYPRFSWQLTFFMSTLCVSLITDLYFFLISRYVTLYLVPFVWVAAYFQIIPLNFYESIEGAVLSFLFLWSFKKLFFTFRKYDGLGQGDIDMLTYIGAFTGILGAWCTLLYACAVSLSYLPLQYIVSNSSSAQIPLGVFLCIGCWINLLFPHIYLALINYN